MSKLAMHIQGKPLAPNNKQVMVQVGWLGATGEIYELDEPPYNIEKGSFTPLYISIGVYELNEEYQYVIHD